MSYDRNAKDITQLNREAETHGEDPNASVSTHQQELGEAQDNWIKAVIRGELVLTRPHKAREEELAEARKHAENFWNNDYLPYAKIIAKFRGLPEPTTEDLDKQKTRYFNLKGLS